MTLPTLNEQVPNVCTLLRTKTAFGSFQGTDAPPWQAGASTTAVFWCLATMTTTGPDDRYCHPHECHEGRHCFHRDE
jgi:hypothetical protein